MPAPTTATMHMPSHEAMDLSIVLQLLKKGIVLIPLIIMFFIFFIRKMLVFPDAENKGGFMKDVTAVGDQTFHHNFINDTASIVTNLTKPNDTLTFRDYFLTSSFDPNMMTNMT